MIPLNAAQWRKASYKSNYVKTSFHHTASKQLKIFFDPTRPISSAHRNEHHIQQIWIHYITQFGIIAITFLRKKTWTTCELKDIQNVIKDKWHDVAIREPESKKPVVEKASSSSGKREWRIYSVIFLLISYWWFGPLWRFGIACVRAATQIWTTCKNCFMACDGILFVSRLIQKFFKQKFLRIFVDVWSLHKCFCAYSFWPLGWITHANVRDVFMRHPVYRYGLPVYRQSPIQIVTIW